VLGAVVTGVASAGATGVLTVSLLGLIFQPLGLPLEAALALLIAIDPVIDIFRTVAIVLTNCAVAAFLYRDARGGQREAQFARRDDRALGDAFEPSIGPAEMKASAPGRIVPT
jgi:Na+/H+-dicarboxylate symporter